MCEFAAKMSGFGRMHGARAKAQTGEGMESLKPECDHWLARWFPPSEFSDVTSQGGGRWYQQRSQAAGVELLREQLQTVRVCQ